MRRYIYFLLILIIAGAAGWYIYSNKGTSVYTNNSAFRAVPIHSPLVIEFQDLMNLSNDLNENNIYQELDKAGIIQSISKNLNKIKQLANTNPEIQKIKNTPFLASFNIEGKNEINILFLASLKDKNQIANIKSIISNTDNSSIKISERAYDNATIFKASGSNLEFSYSFVNGIFIASKKELLVEEAIRQSNTTNLLNDNNFKALNKTANSNSDINIYINHKRLDLLLTKYISPELKNKISHLKSFADWSELDVKLKNEGIYLNGFTFSNDSSTNYINLFQNQRPRKSNIESVLPANTPLFLLLNLENTSSFLTDLEEYSKIHKLYYKREAQFHNITKESKINFKKLFTEIAANEFAYAFGSLNQNEISKNRFFIAEVKSQSLAQDKIEIFFKKYSAKMKIEIDSLMSTYSIDSKNHYKIYKFPYANIAQTLFGRIVRGINCNYLCFYDNYMIFGDTKVGLQEYIHNLALSETLQKDINYQKHKENIEAKSNLHFYLNFSKAFHLDKTYFNSILSEIWGKNEDTFRKFNAFSWQFSNTNNLILNNLYIQFNATIKEEPQTVWQTKLDGEVQTKPKLVINHEDRNNKEIILQDTNNQLYLINKEGITVWKIAIPAPIISEIHQVDYYKNGKLQYLFNTQEKLYLIDKNGNNVANYPVSLRSPATNGVSVFDYDNNKNYRFFIAGKDKKIYAYTKEGKLVNGWNLFTADHQVKKPIHHFRVTNKDYIVFFDQYKTYFLDRRGNIRVKSMATYEHSNNDLILDNSNKPAVLSTDKNGTVYHLYFDGNFKKTSCTELGTQHYFAAKDITGDNKCDFIFAEKDNLMAYNNDGTKIFEESIKKAISDKPGIYQFANNDIKVGVVSSEENRIYLFNSDGSVYDGFPLHGNTKFSIGILKDNNEYFNLLVGNEDNSFFNYMVN